MAYRTKTYIAADWTGDKDAVEQLHKWNDSDHWSLSFIDAHDLTQARDESLNCSIKASLRTRLDASKTFNAATVNKSKCPDSVKNIGTHVAMCFFRDGKYYWDYQSVKAALS